MMAGSWTAEKQAVRPGVGGPENRGPMHVYVVFAHPSKTSFTKQVLDAFVRGLRDGGHVTKIAVDKALALCPAGHPVEHLEEIGSPRACAG